MSVDWLVVHADRDATCRDLFQRAVKKHRRRFRQEYNTAVYYWGFKRVRPAIDFLRNFDPSSGNVLVVLDEVVQMLTEEDLADGEKMPRVKKGKYDPSKIDPRGWIVGTHLIYRMEYEDEQPNNLGIYQNKRILVLANNMKRFMHMRENPPIGVETEALQVSVVNKLVPGSIDLNMGGVYRAYERMVCSQQKRQQ